MVVRAGRRRGAGRLGRRRAEGRAPGERRPAARAGHVGPRSRSTGGVNFMVEQPNRGKRSIGLDLGKPRGLAILDRLVETRRRLPHQLPARRAPPAADRASRTSARVNPKIIYVRGHGHGARGPDRREGRLRRRVVLVPRRHRATRSRPPARRRPVMQRAALRRLDRRHDARRRHRRGALPARAHGRAVGRRRLAARHRDVDHGARHHRWRSSSSGDLPAFDRTSAPNPIVNSYRTKDGRWLFLNMLQPDRFWPDLCRRIGRPELIEDERFADGVSRFQNRAECVRELDEIFAHPHARRMARRARRRRRRLGADAEHASSCYDDPQVIANGYLSRDRRAATARRFALVANPVQFDEKPPHADAAHPSTASTPRRSCSSSACRGRRSPI